MRRDDVVLTSGFVLPTPELSPEEAAKVEAFFGPEGRGNVTLLTFHGACGRGWRQRGNRTGHCSACHETFEGSVLFDAHQRQTPDGSVICADPALMVFRGARLRLVDGSWRGPSPDASVFGGDAA